MAPPNEASKTASQPSFFRRIMELFMLLIATLTAVFFYKTAEEATEEKLRLQEELRRVQRERGQADGRDSHCRVCLDRPLEVALEPCGHVAICRDCANRLDSCPICRTSIAKKKNVFVS
jgi:hypothetical protein